MNIEKQLQDLRDLMPLDKVSYWPFAWGYWLLIGIAGLLLFVLCYFLYQRFKLRGTWRLDYWHRLKDLERQFLHNNHMAIAKPLAELVRGVAINTQPRENSASLTEEQWLQWLTDNDPNKLDWFPFREILCQQAYNNEQEFSGDKNDILAIMYALEKWIKP